MSTGVEGSWVCATCQTANAVGAVQCVVCGARPRPEAGMETVRTVPTVPVAARIPASQPTGPVPPPVGPAPAPPWPSVGATTAAPAARPRREGPSGFQLAAIAVAVLVVAAAVGVGAYLGTRKSDTKPQADAPGSTATGGTDPGSPSASSSSVPSQAITTPSTSGSGTDSPQGYTCAVPGVPLGDTTTYRDPDHQVELLIPHQFRHLDQPSDGANETWTAGDLTVDYVVVPDQVPAAGDARAQLVRSTFTGGTCLDTKLTTYADGRYLESGILSDGTKIYERGRIRCGALVYYRLNWTSDASHALVATFTEANISSTTNPFDAMGGELPECGG